MSLGFSGSGCNRLRNVVTAPTVSRRFRCRTTFQRWTIAFGRESFGLAIHDFFSRGFQGRQLGGAWTLA